MYTKNCYYCKKPTVREFFRVYTPYSVVLSIECYACNREYELSFSKPTGQLVYIG